MGNICNGCIYLSKQGRTVQGADGPYKLYAWVCDKNLFTKINASPNGPQIEECNRFIEIQKVHKEGTTDITTG